MKDKKDVFGFDENENTGNDIFGFSSPKDNAKKDEGIDLEKITDQVDEISDFKRKIMKENARTQLHLNPYYFLVLYANSKEQLDELIEIFPDLDLEIEGGFYLNIMSFACSIMEAANDPEHAIHNIYNKMNRKKSYVEAPKPFRMMKGLEENEMFDSDFKLGLIERYLEPKKEDGK